MLVYFTLSLVVLLGFAGLAVDVGRMEMNTIQLQAVADDVALTAATEYQNGNGSYKALGKAEAAALGVACGLPSVGASIQTGADSGPYAGDRSVIQATVTQTIALYFLPLVTGSKTTTLTAKAVAQYPPSSYFTNASANPSNYSVELVTAYPFDSKYSPAYAAGGISVDSGSNWGDLELKITGTPAASNIAGGMDAVPDYQQTVRADPLAYVAAPVFQACTPGDLGLNITTSPRVLYPGTYCGGLTIANNMTVTLQPGLYIITGGFNLGIGGTLSGDGVTLYFTQGGGSGFGNVKFGSGPTLLATVNLNAPIDSSTAGIAGIVLYVDPAFTATAPLVLFNVSWLGSGVIYSPAGGVSLYTSFMVSSPYLGFDVAYLRNQSTSVHINNNFSTLSTGDPFHYPVLLVQ